MRFSKKNIQTIIDIGLAVIAILAIKSLLQDDSGSVVSNQGARVLEDEDLMLALDEQLSKNDESQETKFSEVIIDLD